jgi:hypothetical protein
VAVVLVAGCGGDGADSPPSRAPASNGPGPIHVHGLGINPADHSLFVATHTGLFRAAPGEIGAKRVADRHQDTMGFTVVGPDHFLGSGHPDGREGLPPFLGLIRSTDAGKSWDPVSLLGKRDFHVLEATGKRVYGYGSDYETREAGLLVSTDGGESWRERRVPEPLIAAAIDPRDSDRVAASGERGLYVSENGARSWRRRDGPSGLLARTGDGFLYVVDADGEVSSSGDDTGFSRVGDIRGQPAAFEGAGKELYVALHDGTVKRSSDRGRSWRVRSRP